MKNLTILLSFILITSCSTPPKRGNSPEEIEKNQITDLFQDGRYLLVDLKANDFKKKHPNSQYRKEVEYTRGKTLEKQERYQDAFAHWTDFSKTYPKFKPKEITQRLSDLKGKEDPPKSLGFLELSYASGFAESGNLNRFESENSWGLNIGYYAHRPGKYVHGFYWNYNVYNFDNVVFPGPELTSDKYDIGIRHFSIGYSFKAELNKDKLQTIISFGPNISRVSLYSENNEIKEHKDLGLNLRASLDYKFYHNKDAMSGNGKWYLTAGYNTYYLHKLEFNNSGRKGFHHAWFIGIKL